MTDKVLENISKINTDECKAIMQNSIEEYIERIRASGEIKMLHKGEILVSPQPYWLESGKCALCVDDPRGDDISLFYFRQGQLVNFLPLLVPCYPIDPDLRKKKLPTSFFKIKALVNSNLVPIDCKQFMEDMINGKVNALLVYSCIQNLLHSYINAYNTPMLSNTRRICRLLLGLMEKGNVIPSYLTHAEISRYLSMHQITVSKIFGKLRSMGILTKNNGELVITDIDTLRKIADGNENITY